MPFLRGSLGFERFSVAGFDSQLFTDEHIDIFRGNAAGRSESSDTEAVHVGYLGGDHLFDQDFDLGKNVINDAAHFSVRIDTNQIPAAIRAAWLQMELAGYAKDSPTGTVSKAQRKDAKEAVEQRCEVEAASGKFRRMQQFPMLWDFANEQLYFGGTVGTSSAFGIDLFERTFEVELRRVGAGLLANDWSVENECYAELDDLVPAKFVDTHEHYALPWANEHSQAPDFLGNEFLLWLWWMTENDHDTITLPDDCDVAVMLTKTLVLECPGGESGKETITAEFPTQLPESMRALQSGKLPRKTGMQIVSDGRTFDLVLNAETFAISGAKIHLDEEEEFDNDDRIDAIRLLSDTVDLMYHTFLARRVGEEWSDDLAEIGGWLQRPEPTQARAAA